jgi:hypothetical protein
MLGRPRIAAPVRMGVALALALLSLWLRSAFPIQALPSAGDDDALFTGMAHTLLTGHWLGPYTDVTLVKGIGYPLFIAASFVAGIPLNLAEQLCAIGGAALAMRVVTRTGRPWVGLALFCVVLADPVAWHPDLSRVIREAAYSGETIALLSLAALVAFPVPSASMARRGAAGTSLGLLCGLYWLTREEGIWLVPAVLLLPAAAALDGWRRGAAAAAPLRLCRAALPWALTAAAMLGVIGTVAQINRRFYGVAVTNELKSLPFRRAYGALSRIRPLRWQRYIVYPPDVRARAEAVSPAARALAPLLDGPVGAGWAQIGCTEAALVPCVGFHAGWFLWVLRDAAQAAGQTRTARDARRFYNRLAQEIDSACATRQLSCLPARATLAPPFRWQYAELTARELPHIAALTLGMGGGLVGTPPSEPPGAEFSDFASLASPLQASHPQWLVATGSLQADRAASLDLSGASPVATSIETAPFPLIDPALPGTVATRFTFGTTCPPTQCTLHVATPDGATFGVKLAALHAGFHAQAHGAALYVQTVREGAAQPLAAAREAILQRVAAVIARHYARTVPGAANAALAGLALATLRAKRDDAPASLLAFAWACACAVACRILLLAYLQVTSVPSAAVRYASPAMPLALAGTVLGLWLGLRSVFAIVAPRHAGAAASGSLLPARSTLAGDGRTARRIG